MKQILSIIKQNIFPLLLIVLPLIFFNKIILSLNLMFFPSQDIISIFSQEKMLLNESLRIYRELPLWNPYVFSGSPFLGNPTSSMFYPINLLFLIFPVDSTFGYIFALDSFLIGIFTYFFAREIKLSKFASFISATTIMFSGPLISLIFPGHLVNFDVFIWFPLILLIYEKIIRNQRIIYAIPAGFFISLSLFAGASQIAAFSILSAFIYFTLRVIASLPKTRKFLYIRRQFAIFLLSIVIGFLLSFVQILPAMEFSKLSARSEGLSYEFSSDFSLHPKQLISFIFPYFFGNPANGTYWGKGNFWSLNGYIGILPLLLAGLALKSKPKSLTIIFLILGLFALIFALGKHSFVFPFFYNHVPMFDAFRAPSRFLYIYAFSFAILAGIGAEMLTRKFLTLKKVISVKIPASFLLIGILTFCILLFVLINNDIVMYEKYILNNSYAVGISHSDLYSQLIQDVLMLSLILLTFPIILFLKLKNKININVLNFLVIIILLFDLWTFNSKIISYKKIGQFYSTQDLISEIKKDKTVFRIFDKEGLYLPISTKNKIENITGVHSLYIKDYRDFVWSIGEHEFKPYESFFQIKNIKNKIFLDLLNVKYVIENNDVIKNPSILPRAYIVPDAIIISKDNILNKLKSENFDPKKQILLQNKPNVSLINPSSFKEVKLSRSSPNKVNLKTNMDEPGFLVLSEIYYPGWKAYDNGEESEIYNANYIFRSIYLTKGIHEVNFIYDPLTFKVGKIVSIVTFFLCSFFLIYKRASILIDIKKLF